LKQSLKTPKRNENTRRNLNGIKKLETNLPQPQYQTGEKKKKKHCFNSASSFVKWLQPLHFDFNQYIREQLPFLLLLLQ
jgi:hypothetical protein